MNASGDKRDPDGPLRGSRRFLSRAMVPAVVLLLCAYPGSSRFPLPSAGDESAALLTAAESQFQRYRYFSDQVSVTQARNATRNLANVPLRDLHRQNAALKESLGALLAKIVPEQGRFSKEDLRAVRLMRQVLADDSDDSGDSAAADCAYDPDGLAAQKGLQALEDRLYACFGRAAENMEFEGKKYDRLSILGLLPLTEDAERRRGLFMALQGVWNAVNRGNLPSSPYRTLVRRSAQSWKSGDTPLDRIARDAGLDLERLEAWIVSALEKWRLAGPQEPVEPWDYDYATSKATRELSRRITSRRRLEELRDRYYASLLGVLPRALGVHFDLVPRNGKDPVAYTTFGMRNRRDGVRWVQGEFWVFASYYTGNLDNLYELIHETGHSIHIAAIQTRPAFQDFPDSDAFTEALADMTGLEVYEPGWQRRFLGVEASLVESVQDKYSSMMMDLAWGLFEIRMYGNPASDPNQVWTDLTRRYLNIKPHPELSWWAIRGQLLDSPGYMLTYAVGDFMSAALRARTQAMRGESVFWNPPTDLYGWLVENLYRYGLEQTALRVLEDFLGGTLVPDPLLSDMSRAGGGRPRPEGEPPETPSIIPR